MTKRVVLFLCTGNSARSQMAEALLRSHAGHRFEVHSAGLDPVGINPFTIRVMNEIGLSLEGHRSKSLREYLGKVSAHFVIFVCEHAERSCPRIWPSALRTDCWPFDDPAACEGDDEEKLQRFRDVREQIDQRITQWLATHLESADLEASEP